MSVNPRIARLYKSLYLEHSSDITERYWRECVALSLKNARHKIGKVPRYDLVVDLISHLNKGFDHFVN